MLKDDKSFITERISEIAEECGRMVLNADISEPLISQKTSFKDIVTKYDSQLQEYIIRQISEILPQAQFIAEELSVCGNLDAENLFIIDPVDGTTNFVHQMGYSAISIAWYQYRKPVFGLVYNPFANELYTAGIGEGAYLNGRQIFTRDVSLSESIVLFGTSPYNSESTDETFEKVKSIYNRCQDIRRLGSAALDICHVADGRAGLYFEASLSLWDYAAAQIILRESGGVLLSFDGNEVLPADGKTSVIAGRNRIIEESGLIGRSRL